MSRKARWYMCVVLSGAILLSLLIFWAESVAAQSSVQTIPVNMPGMMGVNPTTNRIYVASGSNNVSVIDGATNTIIATMIVTSGLTKKFCMVCLEACPRNKPCN
jgi:YVTN family beta-propeller protein